MQLVILIRLALALGLVTILLNFAFPTLRLPIPGNRDPFIELSFFLVSAVIVWAFWEAITDRRR